MAKIKEKPLKALRALSHMTEPARSSQIADIIGEKPIDVGRWLAELLKAGLTEKTDDPEREGLYLWTMTGEGAEYLSNLDKQPVPQPDVTEVVSQPDVTEVVSQPDVTATVSQPPEVVSTVPSQAILLRGIGQQLGVGINKISVCLVGH